MTAPSDHPPQRGGAAHVSPPSSPRTLPSASSAGIADAALDALTRRRLFFEALVLFAVRLPFGARLRAGDAQSPIAGVSAPPRPRAAAQDRRGIVARRRA